ncbi:MAG: SDR family NAD(P)-dependent oxidoreductase [Chlamydiales bacterium]|nr:SDR family NAD(P)-dependent oxidoreductase [Chlamydiales bacterium]
MKLTKAVVTGASSGIGEALARLLADQGISLIITGRNEKRLAELAEELRQKVQVTILVLDLAKSDQRAKLIDAIQEQLPDLVINNAGMGLYGEVVTYETERQFEVYDINATAPFEITIEAARALIAAGKKGVIVNVASSAIYQVFPSFATYAAAKAFIKHFSESMDCETSPKGVRILTSCPGVVETRFQTRAVDHRAYAQQRYNVMTPEFAAQDIWNQIQSGQAVRVFDWRYRVLRFFSLYLSPKAAVLWVLRRFFLGQLPPRDLVPPQPRHKELS